jgi:hypothetical protein
MAKFSVTVQKLWLSKGMKDALKAKIDNQELNSIPASSDTDTETKPGQIFQKGGWMALTYLQTNKYTKFNPDTWEEETIEVDTIKAVKFKIIDGDKIMIIGGKRQINEIDSYLIALATEQGHAEKMNEAYVFAPLEIDLNLILNKYEEKGEVGNVSKIQIKDMEVSIGSINSCTIQTNNYDGVKKILEETEKTESESEVTGLDINIKDKKDTTISINTKGQIRATTKKDNTDLEELVGKAIGLL